MKVHGREEAENAVGNDEDDGMSRSGALR